MGAWLYESDDDDHQLVTGSGVPILTEPTLVTAEELTALADFHRREQWVWSRVAEQEPQYQHIADHHRDKGRRYKELAAASEQEETELDKEVDDDRT